MLSRDEMPDYRSELASVQVVFPTLKAEDDARHTTLLAEVLDYLHFEIDDGIEASDLAFVRSALVQEAKIWIWQFHDTRGTPCYATACERPGQGLLVGYDEQEGLTAEQAILAEYHGCY